MIRRLAEDPVLLIEQGAPHRIHDEKSLARYTQALFRLTAKEAPTEAEHETIDLLTLLIEDYESQYRMPQAGPVEVLKYLMEKSGLHQHEMRAQLGSASNISMVLSGRRNLTLTNAVALADRFNLDVRVFLPASIGRSVQPKSGRKKPLQTKAKTEAPPPKQRRPAALSAA